MLGLVLSTKFNKDTISVWHRTASDPSVVAALKSSIERVINLEEGEGMQLEYENFKEALAAPKKEYRPQNQRGGGNFNSYRGRGGGRGNRGGS